MIRTGDRARAKLPPWLGVFLLAAAAWAPTLANGFLVLGFDDAIVFEAEAVQGLSLHNLVSLFTRPHFAHYVPVAFLSLAVDRQLWGDWALPYHLVNVLLHGAAASLGFLWLRRVLGSAKVAFVAAAIFAVHPTQVEAVSLVIQRKTLLSAVFLFAALLTWRKWRRGGRPALRWASVAFGLLACLSKPVAVVLPVLLVLEEWAFGDRPRLRDKLPFLVVSLAAAAAAVWAHREVGVSPGWQGGDPWSHVRIMARVRMEELLELLVPATAAPAHYYRMADVADPVNLAAAAACVAIPTWAMLRVGVYPRAAFAVGWYVVTLLPSANVVPLVQLRASRFLYLPLLGFGIAVGLAFDAAARWLRPQAQRVVLAALLAGLLAMSWMAIPTWRSDVSAWERAARAHPWSSTAFMMWGRALLEAGRNRAAARVLKDAVLRNPSDAETWYFLARAYARLGDRGRAAEAARTFLTLAPSDPRGSDLADLLLSGP